MNTVKRSFTDDQFREAVESSETVAQILRKLDYERSSYSFVYNLSKKLGINLSHLKKHKQTFTKRTHWGYKVPIEQILVENSTSSNRNNIKKRLLQELKWPYECKECGISEWRGQKLALQLDHINGINNDHRETNLRFLCPNCHSLTETYCGKNVPKKEKTNLTSIKESTHHYVRRGKKNFCGCGQQIMAKSLRCNKCYHTGK
jgi:Zn finger protein HypA/HybF involved in hydrogenase expression